MKIRISKQVFDRLDDDSRDAVTAVQCDCTLDMGVTTPPDSGCELCEGGGVIWEWGVSQATSDAIEENLRKQGVGKTRTH